jgi:tetratricopeptide (TPR) repeat protein
MGGENIMTQDNYLSAQEAMKKQNYEKAEKLFKICVDEYPEEAKLHVSLAMSFAQRGEFVKAKDEVEKCLQDNPNTPGARLVTAYIYSQENRLSEAESMVKEEISIREKDDDTQPHIFLLSLYMAKKRYSEAKKEAKRIFEIQKNIDNLLRLVIINCYPYFALFYISLIAIIIWLTLTGHMIGLLILVGYFLIISISAFGKRKITTGVAFLMFAALFSFVCWLLKDVLTW